MSRVFYSFALAGGGEVLTDGTWYNDPTLLISLSLFCLPLFSRPSRSHARQLSVPPLSVSRYTLRLATNCQSYPRTKPKQRCQMSATHSSGPICISFVLEREIFLRAAFQRGRGGEGEAPGLRLRLDDAPVWSGKNHRYKFLHRICRLPLLVLV